MNSAPVTQLESQPNGEPSVWEVSKLQALLAAGEAAVRRARSVFLTISIAGVLILAAQFNVTLPWARNAVDRKSTSPELKKALEDTLWKDLNVVSVPLVGIKFSAYDLSVVGSIGMAVLSVWLFLFYCNRRENHVVQAIVHEAEGPDRENIDPHRAAYLYHGIAHHFVFMTLVESRGGGMRPQALARGAVKLLHYIPVWVLLLVVANDIFTLSMPHPATIHPGSLWGELSRSEQMEAVLRTLFCLGMVMFSWVQCVSAAEFAADSRTRLNDLRMRVEEPLRGS